MNDHILNHPLVVNSLCVLGVVLFPAFVAVELMPVFGRPIAFLVGLALPGIGARRYSMAFGISYAMVFLALVWCAYLGSLNRAADAKGRMDNVVVAPAQAP